MTSIILNSSIIERLLPGVTETPEHWEKRYPPRNLPVSAKVTRVAPSPTGFMHIGGLFSGLICERLAHQSGGIFYIRLEDTDQKREIPGAVETILSAFQHYSIRADETELLSGEDKGNYGPYRQSRRRAIYNTYIKALLNKGMAYPCFCTPEELENIRTSQIKRQMRPGYYCSWAKWRDASMESIQEALDKNIPFVIRFRSEGDFNQKVKVIDLIKGELMLSDNDQDIVILKADGLPTYHWAHVIDDHLMRTTHVVRGEEWLPSVPLHIQLFNALGWNAPYYGHIAPIYKMEGTSKRKLSKRKDPEANIEYCDQEGFPPQAVIEYLLNLANSSFEDWRKAHRSESLETFPITFEQLGKSAGPLFDYNKLLDVSRTVIANLTSEEVSVLAIEWVSRHQTALADEMKKDLAYTLAIFGIERGERRARKDLAKWSDLNQAIGYFFDTLFEKQFKDWKVLLSKMSIEEAKKIVNMFLESYQIQDTKEIWLDKMRAICRNLGYAETLKDFKKNPTQYKGYLADVANVLRVLLTGSQQSPDLYQIMQVMGLERVKVRLGIVFSLS